MRFNPFTFFKNIHHLYKENFFVWTSIIWRSLTGNFDSMGFLDYVFILPFLIKLACIPDSPFKGFFRGCSNFLSFFKHITALALTAVSSPLSYAAYKCIAYKGRRLEKGILEVEILPVDEEKLPQLNYSTDEHRRISIDKNKLIHMFYGDNSSNRIKLKDHPKITELKSDHMKHYILRHIYLRDEKFYSDENEIIGLFPSRFNYVYSRSQCIVKIYGPPVALIVLSKENKNEILAMNKIDAFYFSLAYNGFKKIIERNIERNIQQDDPLKKQANLRIQCRRTIQFSLQQATDAAVRGTQQSEVAHQIDPVIAEVVNLAGLGDLTSEDTVFLSTFRNSVFYKPTNQWIALRPVSPSAITSENYLIHTLPFDIKEKIDSYLKRSEATVIARTSRASYAFFQSMCSRPVYQLLRHVVRGEQEQAEHMLKEAQKCQNADYTILTTKGTVTDFSKRTFTDITAFQCALWAKDRHMWQMIRKYLPDEEAAKQLQEHENTNNPPEYVKKHGMYFSFTELRQSLKKYQLYFERKIQNLRFKFLKTDNSNREEKEYSEAAAERIWMEDVGGAQSRVPAHVANEYCHPNRSFQGQYCHITQSILSPAEFFKKDIALPRNLMFVLKKSERFPTPCHWFDTHLEDSMYNSVGIFRGCNSPSDTTSWDRQQANGGKPNYIDLAFDAETDFNAICALDNVRTDEINTLRNELADLSMSERYRV